jgi:prepilin-type N-terminal cleavage/methylation domain-containing protein
MENACTTAADEPFRPTRRIHGEARAAFTLVELMVVIVIIGLITAVSIPVIMQALAKARNAAIKSEIDMLHMAIMNYKNEYGSFPPCAPGTTSPSLPIKHVTRLFPRCTNQLQQLVIASKGTDGAGNTDGTCRNNFDLEPQTALVFWLDGYTKNPTSPLIPASARSALFDFEEGRKQTVANRFTGHYHPTGKSGSPYIYIDSALYSAFDYTGGATPGAERVVPFGEFFNKDTFQIICAGRDETYGTDDDLSNFWPGTRKEYRDSK